LPGGNRHRWAPVRRGGRPNLRSLLEHRLRRGRSGRAGGAWSARVGVERRIGSRCPQVNTVRGGNDALTFSWFQSRQSGQRLDGRR
jgi:hypothetical protein